MSYANDDDEDDQKPQVRDLFSGKMIDKSPVQSDLSVRTTGLTPLNSGGTISRNGQAQSYAPSAYAPPTAVARNPAGLPLSPPAIRSTITPPLSPAMPTALSSALPTPGAPVASPTTAPKVQQKESANPLSGDGNSQPPGTTDDLPPITAARPAAMSVPYARQMTGGLFGQRGAGVPRGQDVNSPMYGRPRPSALPVRTLFRARGM